MLNKQITDNSNGKLILLEKSVSLIFNNDKIGNVATQVMESLEFKDDTQITADISKFYGSNIVSRMTDTIEKDLEIKWDIQHQQRFYNVLLQIFKENNTDINKIVMMINVDEDDEAKGLDEDKRKGVLFLGGSFSPC